MAENDRYRRLTSKQLAFVQAFMKLGSTAEAYRKAYDCQRMSAAVIKVKASELSVNPKVAAKIIELQAKAQKRNDVTADRVIQEYAELAFLEFGAFVSFTEGGDMVVDWEGFMRSPANRAIKSLTQKNYFEGHGKAARMVVETKVTFHGKTGPLRDLARHLGLFPKDGATPLAERFQIILNLQGNAQNGAPSKKKPTKKIEGTVVK